MPETVARNIISFLAKQGTEFIFSHPGGPVLPLYDALKALNEPRNVLVRHEGAGSFMAEAYAKVTGRVGVCASTMGPGAANMTIGVGTAMSDSTPLIAITGQMPITSTGRGYQQETDHRALFGGITKQSIQLNDPRNALEVFERAYRIAVSGRPGPVHVDVPVNISSSLLEERYEPREVRAVGYGPARRDMTREAARLIAGAERPVIIAGGGVIIANGSEELRRFSESFGIPVATSYNGRGSISEDHALAIGRIGEFTPSYSRKIAESADLLLAVGYRFTDVSTEGWKIAPDAKVIQIDVDPTEIGRNVEVSVGLVGDAGQVLSGISSEMSETGRMRSTRRGWLDQIDAARQRWRSNFSAVASSNSKPIKPQRVMKEISSFLGRNAIIAAGAGRAKMWAASLIPIREPRTWIHSGGYAVMGYELCAAFASKLARPASEVLAVCGDASFQMVCQELATAAEQRAPFTTCILNDVSLGSIRAAQLKRYGYSFGTEFGLDVNLAEVAKSFGANGTRITDASDIASALQEARTSERPTVLDIVVDGSETPNLD